jgi:hypothetical protein
MLINSSDDEEYSSDEVEVDDSGFSFREQSFYEEADPAEMMERYENMDTLTERI